MILVVDPEAPQTVGIGKSSQRAQLFLCQWLLQFVSCFYKCHAPHSSTDFRPGPASVVSKHSQKHEPPKRHGLWSVLSNCPMSSNEGACPYRGRGYMMV